MPTREKPKPAATPKRRDGRRRRPGAPSASRTKVNLYKVDRVVVAEVFGVVTQNLQYWTGCPRNEDGTYDLFQVVRWWKERYKNQIQDAKRVGEEKNPELARSRRITADTKALDFGIKTGQYVLKSQVIAKWGNLLSQLSQRLQGLPAQIALRLVAKSPAEIAQTIREELEVVVNDTRAQYDE